MIKNKNNIVVQKIENSTIHFLYEENGEFIFKLYSGDNLKILEYSTTLNINKHICYWISHPCLLIEEDIKISVFDFLFKTQK